MNQALTSLAEYYGYASFEALGIDVGWRLLITTLIILAGWLAMRFMVRAVTATLERAQFPDATVRGVIALLLRWAVILLTGFYAMRSLGVEATAILGIVTGSALAIGLAMQGTLSNVASGIMLLILRPISVGDYMAGGGHEGTVVTVGIFYTTIDTLERYRISIPNSALFGAAIINYSKNPVMTARLLIGVAYDANLDQVKHILIAAMRGVEGVRQTPEPSVLIQDLADSAVNLEVRFEAKREVYWPTLRAARQAAKEALDAAGIEIPFPQTTVHYRATT